jgi:hypothetical protein
VLQEVREGRPHGVERSLHVHVDHLLDLLGRELEERSVGADAGVRDEDVEPAEAVHRRGHERVDLSGVANVARLGHDVVETEVAAAPRGETEPHALFGEGAGHGRADPAARAGHNCDLALETRHDDSSRCSAREPTFSGAEPRPAARG